MVQSCQVHSTLRKISWKGQSLWKISLQNLIQYRIKALITNLSQEITTQGSKKEIIKS